jgi:hypothetical protein
VERLYRGRLGPIWGRCAIKIEEERIMEDKYVNKKMFNETE